MLDGRQLVDQRVLRGEHHVGRPEERVRPGREDRQRFVATRQGEVDLGALAASDPVGLHELDLLGPLDRRQVVQETLGVVGGAEVPLLEVLLGDVAAAAPAVPLLDLLVGEDRLAARAPPLLARPPIGEPALVHEEEEPLRPAVVVRQAAGDLARPVERQADHVHLAVVVGDVALGRHPWVHAHLEGVVLGREPERVPAHRVQHVVPAHAVITRHDVGGHVIAAVPHGEPVPGGIREEVEAVELGLCRRVGRAVGVALLPEALPPGLDLLRVVAAVHAVLSREAVGPGGRAAGDSPVRSIRHRQARGRPHRRARRRRSLPRARLTPTSAGTRPASARRSSRRAW